MNRRQANKLESYLAVDAVLTSNPEFAALPGLPAKLTRLSAKIDEIKTIVHTQTQPLQASTAQRDQRLEEMAGTTIEVAGVLMSFAHDQSLPDLRRSVDVGADIRRVRLTHRVILAQRVLEAAEEWLPQLGAYGVTPETLASFEARIIAADEGLSIPRSAIVARKAATVKLASLFAEVGELLKEHIDRLVYPLRTHVELYASYLAARSVVGRRGARRATEEATSIVAAVATTENAAA